MRIEKQHHCDCNCIIDNTTIVTNYVIFTVKYTVYLEGESKIIDQTEMIVCPNGVRLGSKIPSSTASALCCKCNPGSLECTILQSGGTGMSQGCRRVNNHQREGNQSYYLSQCLIITCIWRACTSTTGIIYLSNLIFLSFTQLSLLINKYSLIYFFIYLPNHLFIFFISFLP